MDSLSLLNECFEALLLRDRSGLCIVTPNYLDKIIMKNWCREKFNFFKGIFEILMNLFLYENSSENYEYKTFSYIHVECIENYLLLNKMVYH